MQENGEDHDCMIRDEEGRLVPDYDQTIKIFEEGDIVSGKVVKVDRDEVLVDIGYKSEGVIPIRELSIRSGVDPGDVVTVGDDIDALVLQKEDNEGRLILSKKRAEFEKAWDRIEELCKGEKTIIGKAIEIVKGGLIVDIGLRGFLPASLVDLRRVKDLNEFLGQELECKIIEMNRTRNNVVLSRRAVLEEARKAEKLKLLAKLQKGQVLTGQVSSLVDFGAFVDLGGIDGLIHISELSWTHINEPSEVVSVGAEIKVQVLDVDMERERISLGYKQTQEDPWREEVKKFNADDIIEGKITKIVPFGVFVQMSKGVEALVHISELAQEHVEMPEHVVKVGDVVRAKIVDIDMDRRRVSLSIKRVLEEEEQVTAEAVEEAEQEEEPQAVEEEKESEEVDAEVEEEVRVEEEESAVEETPQEDVEPVDQEKQPENEKEELQEQEDADEAEEAQEVKTEEGEKAEEPVAKDVETTVSSTEEKVNEPEKVQDAAIEDDEKLEAAGEGKNPVSEEGQVKELATIETRYEEAPEPSSLEAVLEQMKEKKSQDKESPVN